MYSNDFEGDVNFTVCFILMMVFFIYGIIMTCVCISLDDKADKLTKQTNSIGVVDSTVVEADTVVMMGSGIMTIPKLKTITSNDNSTLNINSIIVLRDSIKLKTDNMYKLQNHNIKRIAIIVARKINECAMQHKYILNTPFAGIKNVNVQLKEAIMQIFQKRGYEISIVSKKNVNHYKISWR